MQGYIYQVTCKPTSKKYIGQATEFKYKHEKPYNYGPVGRWSDHVCASKTRNTPLAKAIKEYGKDAFEIEILEKSPLTSLDEREAYWILKNNTAYPNGYNVSKHARNRHRENSNLHVFYINKVDSAILTSIKNNGELKLVYVYLTLKNGEKERIVFGQNKESTYDDAFDDAEDFVNNIGCPYKISSSFSNNLSEKYASKLEELSDKEITTVRITTASHLVAVYIGTSEMKKNSEHKRICFGGKTISFENAYNIAKEFVAELNIPDELIKDSVKVGNR